MISTSSMYNTMPMTHLPAIIPSGSPPLLNSSQSPMLLPMSPSPITPMSPIPSIQSTLTMLPPPPMLSIISSTKQTDSAHADLPATLPLGHVNVTALQNECRSLQNEFDKVCNIVHSQAQKLQEKDAQINKLTNQLSKNGRTHKAMQIVLEKQIKKLKYKVRRLEMDDIKMDNIKVGTLQELYFNSSPIRQFKNNFEKFGKQMGSLREQQYELTQCIGKNFEKMVSIKDGIAMYWQRKRMGALYHDIAATEASYNKLFSCLDVVKTDGKQIIKLSSCLELIVKDRAYIKLLEEDKLEQSKRIVTFDNENREWKKQFAKRDRKWTQCSNELKSEKLKVVELLNRMRSCNASPMVRPRLCNKYNSY